MTYCTLQLSHVSFSLSHISMGLSSGVEARDSVKTYGMYFLEYLLFFHVDVLTLLFSTSVETNGFRFGIFATLKFSFSQRSL
jgi:hypothetical protein